MRILAIDTSTPYTFIAECVYNDTWSLLKFSSVIIDKQRDNWLETLVQDFSGKKGLKQYDGFAVGSGPGSFTGLRISFTYFKTFAIVWNRIFTAFSTPVMLASLFCGNRESLLVQLNTNLYYSCDPTYLDDEEKIQPLENWFKQYPEEGIKTSHKNTDKIWLWNLYGQKPELQGNFSILNPENQNSTENIVINLPHPKILTENKIQNLTSLPDYGHSVVAKRKL